MCGHIRVIVPLPVQRSTKGFLTLPSLAGFACGVCILQTRASLPAHPWMLAAGGALVLALAIALALTLALVPVLAPTQPSSPTWWFRPRALAALLLAIAASATLGYGYAAWRGEARLADELPVAWEDRDIRVIGIVDDLPQNNETGSRFAFAIERALTAGAVLPRRVSVAWFAPRAVVGARSVAPRAAQSGAQSGTSPLAPLPPVIHAGERWHLTVKLRRPHGNVNPDGFDLEAWLLEHDLRATGYVREDPGNVRTDAFAGRVSDYIQRAREGVRTRIAGALPRAPYAGVLTALAIGDQRAIAESQWRVFNATGVTHLVSISGLHVTVFATLAGGFALGLARRCARLTRRIPARKVAAVAGSVFAFGYVLLAGAEVPAVRTLLMLLVAAAGLWLGRPGTASLVWSWSLVAVLLWDPWAGLAPGFWLSFGAVGLLLYAGSARLASGISRTVAQRWCAGLREAAHAQWIVTVGLVPGTLALFQQVSLVSTLANSFAIPVVTLGVVPLALLGIVVPLDILWMIAHHVLALLMRYLEWLAELPMATWAAHAPRMWTVPVAIAGLLWMLAPRGVPGRALGALWTLPMALLLPPAPPDGAARIVVLDVGQGLSVAVVTAHHALVYDTGPRFNDSVDAGGRFVVPYLRAAGIRALDALVVSHADSDHSGGALSILHALPVARLLSSLPVDHPIVVAAGGDEPGAHGVAQTLQGVRQIARSAGPAVRRVGQVARCMAGDHWEWDGVVFDVLHPSQGAYEDPARKSNDLSCVLRVATRDGRALLTGDIEAASERELLLHGVASLRSEVLVVPHHGSRTSSSPAFIAAVAPQVAIVAAGYHNRFRHPRPDITLRYVQAGAAVPRTDLQGAITVRLDPGRPIDAIAERERRRRYWYDRRRRGRLAGAIGGIRGCINRRSDRFVPRFPRFVAAAKASPARNRRRGLGSRGRRRVRSTYSPQGSSSDPARATQSETRRSRWSQRR